MPSQAGSVQPACTGWVCLFVQELVATGSSSHSSSRSAGCERSLCKRGRRHTGLKPGDWGAPLLCRAGSRTGTARSGLEELLPSSGLRGQQQAALQEQRGAEPRAFQPGRVRSNGEVVRCSSWRQGRSLLEASLLTRSWLCPPGQAASGCSCRSCGAPPQY